MKVITMMAVAHDTVAGALFPGDPVERRSLIGKADSDQISFTLLTFGEGSANAFHTHTNDQAIVIIEGVCIVATEHETREVTAADVVIFPAGENHMHGPKPGHRCSMISITPQGTTTKVM